MERGGNPGYSHVPSEKPPEFFPYAISPPPGVVQSRPVRRQRRPLKNNGRGRPPKQPSEPFVRQKHPTPRNNPQQPSETQYLGFNISSPSPAIRQSIAAERNQDYVRVRVDQGQGYSMADNFIMPDFEGLPGESRIYPRKRIAPHALAGPDRQHLFERQREWEALRYQDLDRALFRVDPGGNQMLPFDSSASGTAQNTSLIERQAENQEDPRTRDKERAAVSIQDSKGELDANIAIVDPDTEHTFVTLSPARRSGLPVRPLPHAKSHLTTIGYLAFTHYIEIRRMKIRFKSSAQIFVPEKPLQILVLAEDNAYFDMVIGNVVLNLVGYRGTAPARPRTAMQTPVMRAPDVSSNFGMPQAGMAPGYNNQTATTSQSLQDIQPSNLSFPTSTSLFNTWGDDAAASSTNPTTWATSEAGPDVLSYTSQNPTCTETTSNFGGNASFLPDDMTGFMDFT